MWHWRVAPTANLASQSINWRLFVAGALVYESTLGRPPFSSRNMTNLYRKIAYSELSFPPAHGISETGESFISALSTHETATSIRST